MKRIDWDKARRDKNARKPDYRESLKRGWAPDESANKAAPSAAPQKPAALTGRIPVRAGEIRAKLRSFGLSGAALTKGTEAVLRGATSIAWVEFGLQLAALEEAGFQALPVEQGRNLVTLRLRKTSASGRVEDERTYTLRRVPTSPPH